MCGQTAGLCVKTGLCVGTGLCVRTGLCVGAVLCVGAAICVRTMCENRATMVAGLLWKHGYACEQAYF